MNALLRYDDHCPMCTRTVARLAPLLGRYRIGTAPLPEDDARTEMRFEDGGRVWGGADAVAEMARRIWWAIPFWLLTKFPGVMPLLRAMYRQVAARRTCADGACALRPAVRYPARAAAVPLLLIAAGIFLCFHLPAWLGMWVLAGSIFTAAKWTVWWPERRRLSVPVTASWFLLWPGMDPAWLRAGTPAAAHFRVRGAVHLAIGLTLLLVAVPRISHPQGAAWVGMIGLINALHFGIFDLLAGWWQSRGRSALPLMNQPLASRTLTEFWGRRWNTAFNYLAQNFVFRPLVRKAGVPGAMLATFVASGLVHDLVISLPARGGWGMPALYFTLQGIAVLAERRWKLRGRAWVWAATGLPLPLCFPPDFATRVILPFFSVLGLR